MLKTIIAGAMWIGIAAVAAAQAPAGAPAGATGICRDGSYSMQATKSGACGGHKGVQTWYAATPAPAAKAGTPAAAAPAAKPAPAAASAPAPKAPAAMPAPMPAPAASVATKPAPTPAASAPAAMPATAATAKKAGPAAAANAKTAAPGGGPGLVWVNTASKVYHCNGDTYNGKTKAGAYMSEADAQKQGAHAEKGQSCAGK